MNWLNSQRLVIEYFLWDPKDSIVRGFTIPHNRFDDPLTEMARLSLSSINDSIPLEDSVQLLIVAEDEVAKAQIACDTLVKGKVTTAGGRPLIWDQTGRVYRLEDGARYSVRYGGLVPKILDLDKHSSEKIASFLNQCNVEYPSGIKDEIRQSTQVVLQLFVKQYLPH